MKADETTLSVQQLYLATADPPNTEFRDYRLMFGPDTESTEPEWVIYRCTEDGTYIPESTKLYVFRQGDVIDYNGNPFQVNLAQLVQPNEVDPDEYDGAFIEFPDELTGETWPAKTPISNDELGQFLLSVAE